MVCTQYHLSITTSIEHQGLSERKEIAFNFFSRMSSKYVGKIYKADAVQKLLEKLESDTVVNSETGWYSRLLTCLKTLSIEARQEYRGNDNNLILQNVYSNLSPPARRLVTTILERAQALGGGRSTAEAPQRTPNMAHAPPHPCS